MFAPQMVQFFSNDPAVIESGIIVIYGLTISVPLVGFYQVYTSKLQAIGKGKESVLLATARQGYIFVPLVFILNSVFGMYGLFFAQAVADAITFIITLVIARKVNKEIHELELMESKNIVIKPQLQEA